ncbi:uncharacterized protein LOC18045441 isoform X3 [Citrus clementina]|uniref:uncharacterized protein LOC18045441 isoform X3 n=1 Tax=Citrus clementina TaxID=85681 RepID=UPI000CECEA22|nr:uncharacterized protein LOC18045441 isoform X3 [Citrus x clementina]
MGSDSKKSNNNSNVAGGASQIPAAAKKIVQNLKETLNKNCTDSEIYAVLVECNMDPNDAFQRLLSQDAFKEVKSKRERRKEMKETQESRARSNSVTANRGARFGSEQAVGQTGSTENNYNELGKTANKREMGSAAPSGSSSSSYTYHATGKIINEQPPIHSDFFNADNRRQLLGTGDTISSSMQMCSGNQPTWPGISKGQVSLADIVRGRPLNIGSQMSSEISCTSQAAVLPNSIQYHNKNPQVLTSPELHQDPYSSHPSNSSEKIHGCGRSAGLHDFDDEWPVIEHLPAATGLLITDASATLDADGYSNRTCLYSDRAKLSRHSESDDIQISQRHYDSHNQSSNSNESVSVPSRRIFADGAGGVSNDDLLKETSSHDSHGRMFQEGIANVSDLPSQNYSASLNDDVVSALSSAVANLQQLNIGKEEPVMPPTENHSAVVLPNHLQTFAADCSHLSFGTYKSGVTSASPTVVAFNPIESNLEVSAADAPSAMYNFRNSEYLGAEQFGFMHDTHRVTAETRNYDPPVSSQPELMKQDIPQATREHEYITSLSLPGNSMNDIQQSDSNFPFVAELNERNLPSVPSETNFENIPSGLLAPTRQSLRMRDSSSFLATQSMPSGYGSTVSLHATMPVSEHNRSSTWDLGASRQASSMHSDSAYYSLLRQNQHHPGYQVDQQASQHYESLGYPNPNTYHSDRITRTSAPRPW